jgi:hypothetical protein
MAKILQETRLPLPSGDTLRVVCDSSCRKGCHGRGIIGMSRDPGKDQSICLCRCVTEHEIIKAKAKGAGDGKQD